MTDTNGRNNPIVWLVDENRHALRTFCLLIKDLLPSAVEVKELLAYPKLKDYLPLLENPKTACIITDQRLTETGVADYTGIDLAKFLRDVTNTKLPIYILTAHAEDKDAFIDLEWSIEAIIPKDIFIDDLNEEKNQEKKQRKNLIFTRLVRQIDVYQDMRNKRQERIQQLLKKSLDGELEAKDLTELEQLDLEKNSPFLAQELGQIKKFEEFMNAHESLMKKLEALNQNEKTGEL